MTPQTFRIQLFDAVNYLFVKYAHDVPFRPNETKRRTLYAISRINSTRKNRLRVTTTGNVSTLYEVLPQ